MGKLVSCKTPRVLKALARAGWRLRETKRGAKHYVLVNSDRPGILTVPRHSVVAKGTLRAIIRQAGLTVDEFEKLYR